MPLFDYGFIIHWISIQIKHFAKTHREKICVFQQNAYSFLLFFQKVSPLNFQQYTQFFSSKSTHGFLCDDYPEQSAQIICLKSRMPVLKIFKGNHWAAAGNFQKKSGFISHRIAIKKRGTTCVVPRSLFLIYTSDAVCRRCAAHGGPSHCPACQRTPCISS